MDTSKKDRRVRKTKKQLLLGLTNLMQKKDIRDITVRELTDLADINRGTFYLHYKDIYDMIDHIENELFIEFNTLVNKHSPSELNSMPFLLLKDIFKFIADNAEIAMVLVGNHSNITFLNKLKNIVRNRSIDNLMVLYNTDKEQNIEFFVSFVVAGCLALVEDWLEKGMKESPEQMAALAENIIKNGINVLK